VLRDSGCRDEPEQEKASFYVLPTTQYNISFSAVGHTFDPPYIFTSFANPQIIYVITHSSNASFVANDVDVNSAINFNVLATPVNDTALYLNMTYLDTTGTTTSGTVDVIAENNTPYQPNTTVASWSITSSSATDSILIIHQQQLNLQVKGKFITTQFGTVNREYGFAVKGPAVSFMGFSSNIALLFALGVMMMTVMLATAMAARQVAVIMCLESWIFYSLGWLNSLIARGVPESLILLGMTIATVASIFAVFETRKKREKY
jgi:hypothetical protein